MVLLSSTGIEGLEWKRFQSTGYFSKECFKQEVTLQDSFVKSDNALAEQDAYMLFWKASFEHLQNLVMNNVLTMRLCKYSSSGQLLKTNQASPYFKMTNTGIGLTNEPITN